MSGGSLVSALPAPPDYNWIRLWKADTFIIEIHSLFLIRYNLPCKQLFDRHRFWKATALTKQNSFLNVGRTEVLKLPFFLTIRLLRWAFCNRQNAEVGLHASTLSGHLQSIIIWCEIFIKWGEVKIVASPQGSIINCLGCIEVKIVAPPQGGIISCLGCNLSRLDIELWGTRLTQPYQLHTETFSTWAAASKVNAPCWPDDIKNISHGSLISSKFQVNLKVYYWKKNFYL